VGFDLSTRMPNLLCGSRRRYNVGSGDCGATHEQVVSSNPAGV
jgi:hypothetical protein